MDVGDDNQEFDGAAAAASIAVPEFESAAILCVTKECKNVALPGKRQCRDCDRKWEAAKLIRSWVSLIACAYVLWMKIHVLLSLTHLQL
jgi:hypothetical protein